MIDRENFRERNFSMQSGKAKKADFVLYYKPNIPIALIEATDNNHSVGDPLGRRTACSGSFASLLAKWLKLQS
jgi:type I site-specific restriction endonuclease